jgi:hypothetical protein
LTKVMHAGGVSPEIANRPIHPVGHLGRDRRRRVVVEIGPAHGRAIVAFLLTLSNKRTRQRLSPVRILTLLYNRNPPPPGFIHHPLVILVVPVRTVPVAASDPASRHSLSWHDTRHREGEEFSDVEARRVG